MKNRIIFGIIALYIILFIGGAFASANITSYNPAQETTSILGEEKLFNIDINETVNVTWYIDKQLLKSDTTVKTSSFSNRTTPVGQHTVEASVINMTTGTEDKQTWIWNVNAVNQPSLEIVEYTPITDFTNLIGTPQMFSIKTNKNAEIRWYINNELKQTNSTTSSAIYGTIQSEIGNYIVTAVAAADGVEKRHTWNWRVDRQRSTINSGNRIWDANENMPLDYTWDALSFSGFYYDINKDEGSEKMTVHLDSNSDRSINKGDLRYETNSITKDFEYKDWGSYEVIGFMSENYFAGYIDNSHFTKANNLMNNGILSKVLIDDNKKHHLYSGTSFSLEEGYAINLEEIDLEGNSVYLNLTKDGTKIDETIVKNNENYVYETNIDNSEKIPIISIHFDNIFQGSESSAVFVDGIFQISDKSTTIDSENKYGAMKFINTDNSRIVMENDDDMSLSQGRKTDIMGNLKFIVADDSILRFAPVVEIQNSTYEQRGTIAHDQSFEWTPLNFEGFYYNIDEGIGTEKLSVLESGRSISKDRIEYTSTSKNVKFQYSPWGEFDVVGFMGNKYFAGYPQNGFTKEISLVSQGTLSKVLMDDDNKQSLYSGSNLNLNEGYSLSIKEVDLKGQSAYISLSKDGQEIDNVIVPSESTYTYKKSIGNSDEIPIIVVHFKDIFQGTESNAIFIDGIFQISDQPTYVENGESFGKMEVTSLSEDGIKMSNKDSLSLSRDSIISLMGDISFKVADSDTLRYYPFLKINGSSPTSLKIDHGSIVVQGSAMNITVTSNGTAVESSAIKIDGRNIGNTSANGIMQYIPNSIGNFTITAEKPGYIPISSHLQVVSSQDESRKMTIEILPEEVINGSSMQLRVLNAVAGQPIENVKIQFNGTTIGNTSNFGNITYIPTKAGIYKLTASKDGLLTSQVDVNVKPLAANFVLNNLQIAPLKVKTGENTNISVNVTNDGTVAGEYNLELKVNGTAKANQPVKLEKGASTTVIFSNMENESGIYGVNIQGVEGTYEVYKESHLILYIFIMLVIIILAGLIYLFTIRGWSVDIAKAKINEYIGK